MPALRLVLLVTLGFLQGCVSAPAPTGPNPGDSKPTRARRQIQGIVAASAIDAIVGEAVPSDACQRTAHRFLQPVAVRDDAGLERYPAVIGFPMAFPRGGKLASLTGFVAATPGGELLATQGEVLSRWGDGPQTCDAPIRWGYFYAAGHPSPGQRAYLTLKHDAGVTPVPPIRLLVDSSDKRVVISTGPARFTIRKDWFNGLSLVELKRGETWTTVAEVPSRADVGMLVLRHSQLASPINGKVLSFEVERAGPVVATIAVKGTYAFRGDKQFYRYTLRMHFYAGSSAVQLDHTYYNGETVNASAEGAKNRKVADRVFMRIPLKLGQAPVVQARATAQVHGISPTGVVSVQQYKRSPDRPAVVFAVKHGKEQVQLGASADKPFIAAVGSELYAVATIAYMGQREPQALRYDPAAQLLELDWQSEELFVGGAKGIWSKAAVDFGFAAAVDMSTRADQLQAHVTRPLIGAPRPAYINSTHAYGLIAPSQLPDKYKQIDEDISTLHAQTVDYLRRYRITGSQIWPDLNRAACSKDNSCERLAKGFFEGGDNNYWDWAMAELEQFLRTAEPAYLHDFALGEAMTMAETVSFRPNWYDKNKESVFAGLSPCNGTARGWGGPWIEGLTHRTGNCAGDYGYNKLHRLAYILTADRRFTDLFTDGANTAIRQYGLKFKDKPEDWRELSVSRQTSQYFEPLLTAAEFGRIGGDKENRKFGDVAKKYFDFMYTRALQRGHSCNLIGTGYSSPGLKGDCTSAQQWMMPIFVDWVIRLHYMFDHAPAREWLLQFVARSTKETTVLDNGVPDISEERGSDGWRTVYYCKADKTGILDKSCEKVTDFENGAYYYTNGLIAYLNALAIVGEVDPKDTLGLCKWLPAAYTRILGRLDREELNDFVWGKSPGQAYAFAQRAVGVLSTCEKK